MPNKYKVLVSKKNGMFGVFHDDELWDSDTPVLLGATTTMDQLKKLASPTGNVIRLKNPEELNNYDLASVELTLKP